MTTDEAARESNNLQRKQGDLVEKLLVTIENLTDKLKLAEEKIKQLEQKGE